MSHQYTSSMETVRAAEAGQSGQLSHRSSQQNHDPSSGNASSQENRNRSSNDGSQASAGTSDQSTAQAISLQEPIWVRAFRASGEDSDFPGPVGYDQLVFGRDAVFKYTARFDDHWGLGAYGAQEGAFPFSHVERVRSLADTIDKAAAGFSLFWIGFFRLLSVFSVFLNISLWVFLGIQTAQRDEWYKDKDSYKKNLGYKCVACFVVISCGGFVISAVCTKARHPVKKLQTSHVVDSLNGLLCWVLPLVYLWTGAFPQYYDQPQWELTTQYVDSVPPPGFAVLGGYNDAAAAHVISNWTCTFPWDKPCNDKAWVKNDTISLQHYGDLTPYVFNSEDNSGLSYNETSDDLVLQLEVNYNHTLLQHTYSNAANWSETAVQSPYLFASMYDSRLPDLGRAIDCGLIALTEIPALASNTLMFTASYIIDDRGMILDTPDLADNTCKEIFQAAYELDSPPYTSYSFHAASMPITDPVLCDISTYSNASCVLQNVLRLEKHVIDQMESKPGVEPKDVWLNVAAIVGGVQFLAWWVEAFIDIFWPKQD